jgi:hypothetical protein
MPIGYCYHYKMKDDAIAQLSDQVMALTARTQEFERKQDNAKAIKWILYFVNYLLSS